MKTKTLAEIRSMKAAGELRDPKPDAAENSVPDEFWEGATVKSNAPTAGETDEENVNDL